ncbi:MAG TPA: TorF family putative porin [Xanthobacteraceae bacterium]|nr:TorF family putative porin [Xanthobacteraceae bacterium]
MRSDVPVEFGCAGARAAALVGIALLWLAPASVGSAHAQPRDNNAVGAISLGARGVAAEAPARTAPSQEGATSPLEYSFRAGFASDYIYRGTTLSDRRPAVGAAFEAALGIFYAGATVTSVKLPSQPAAEITMGGGVRPKLGEIAFDFGWTYFYYPGETVPIGTNAGIEYWEAVARADTKIGELLRVAGGFAYSPNVFEYRRLEQIRGIRSGRRPAKQRFAAGRHCVADRRRRLLLVRQSVGVTGRLPAARLSQLERGHDLRPQEPQPRPALLRHQSVEGELLRLHRRSQRHARRADRPGDKPARSHVTLVQRHVRREVLVCVGIEHFQEEPAHA